MNLISYDVSKLRDAIQSFWDTRDRQQQKQIQGGKIDAGTRGAVTGGSQMGAIEVLVTDILRDAGLDEVCIKTKLGLELPGYFRPVKKWDLLVVSRNQLVCAIEFKSHVGPSFGNNFNNRAEEAIGNAVDMWTAYRERFFQVAPKPFLGYFLLLEDCPKVHSAVKFKEPHFPADPVFHGASYAKRYEMLCRRLVLEKHYDAACLTLTTKSKPTTVNHPADDLSFHQFVRELRATAMRFSS